MNINNLRTRYVYRMIKDRVLKRERARYSPIKEIVIRND